MKMKRLIPILIIFSLLLSLSACSGNYAKVDLQKPVSIPENGIIKNLVIFEGNGVFYVAFLCVSDISFPVHAEEYSDKYSSNKQ